MGTTDKELGRRPNRSDVRALMFAEFVRATAPAPPKKTNFWTKRTGFPLHTFGNTLYGDCTRAKQAHAMLRMERIETRQTPKIFEDEVIRVYRDMCVRFYGSDADEGAYEVDALSDWRNPDYTIRDTKGRPLTIDAYTRIDAYDHYAMKQAMALAGAHGIAVCLGLPRAFSMIEPPADWDIPEGQPLIGKWAPYSWGGHSMWARDYDEIGIWLVHTWGLVDQRITWRAAAAYLDEAHLVIDSLDYWRKVKKVNAVLKVADLRDAVNAVSSIKIAA